MKRGLVLEGGGMRGMFTAGVIDVMMEQGIEYDGAVGVSAGAVFGCNYKSRQIGRGIRYNKRFCADKRYCGMESLLKTGDYYSREFCYRDVPLKYDLFDFDTYDSNPMEFYVVCTDIETGKPFYHKHIASEDQDFAYLRASASMPLVSNIVEVDGTKLLDGGISDSIPVQFMMDLGYDRNVAILTQPASYTKKKNEMMPLVKVKYRKYPNLIRVMENRHKAYNQTLALITRLERQGKLFVIRPDRALPVSRTEKDPERIQQAYDIGRSIAEREMEALRAYLEE